MEQEATKEQPSTFQRLKDNLPIISIGLLVIGTVNLMVFYSYFNINILEYLDFTEVLQLQFKLFAIAVAVIIFQIAYAVLSPKFFTGDSPAAKRLERMRVANRRRSAEEYEAKKEEAKKHKKITKRQRFFKKHKVETVCLSIIAACYTILFIIQRYPKFIIIILFFSIPVFCILTFITYDEIKKKTTESTTKAGQNTATLKSIFSLYKYTSITVILIYISCIAALINDVNVVSEKSAYEVTAVMDNKTLVTSQDYRYLGRTKNYIFFFTISKQQAEVYPISAVKTMLIRNGIDYSHAEEREHKITLQFVNDIINWFANLFKK